MRRPWCRWPAAWALSGALSGCALPPETTSLRVELPPELAERAEELRILPHIALSQRRTGRGIVELQLKRAAGWVKLELPGACPEHVVLEGAEALSSITLRPLFEVGPSERVVGLGRDFELRARPLCAEAQQVRATFSVAGGAPLADVEVSQDGRVLRGAVSSLPPAHAQAFGVIPVGAREQRRLRSEISLRLELPGGAVLERRLGISAVARASGLPNVGLFHPVLLAGSGWMLSERPPGSRATLRDLGGTSELTPDAEGVYRLLGSAGKQLSLQSGRYDQTPLDCGRSDCHSEIASSAAQSPMTQVLASDLGGCHALESPVCASACHATGEPGIDDGGFEHVARELALPALPLDYEDLPRALRRVGGVGCLACHGPGAIPEPSARWAILRSDVCAVCHDAPPRYGHLAAFAASRMARADEAPRARQPACARCHTSWGALGEPAPPEEAAPLGLSCAVCHDPHPHGESVNAPRDPSTPSHGLLRARPLPAWLRQPPDSFVRESRVCIGCHAPSSLEGRPEASAAALLAGQGGLVPETGAPLVLPSPHAQNPRACLGCHDSGPPGLTLGTSHGFRATETACSRCHQRAPTRDPSLAARARALLARLGARELEPPEPWHAHATPEPPATSAVARARRDVLLVLEDPAADVHHPAYAAALLDAAERIAPGTTP